MGALGSALEGVAHQRRESASPAHPAGPYMKPGRAPGLSVPLRPGPRQQPLRPRARAADGESAPSNAGAKVRVLGWGAGFRNSSGGQSGALAPHGDLGAETFEMVHFSGDVFSERSTPTPTPAWLPCPRGCPPPDGRGLPRRHCQGRACWLLSLKARGHGRSLPGAPEAPDHRPGPGRLQTSWKRWQDGQKARPMRQRDLGGFG